MRAENEYLKSFGRYKGGEEKRKGVAQYAVVDQSSFKGYSILMLCEIAHVSRSGFWYIGSEDVVRLLVNN
ncbi:hypothetical protein P7H12_09785 [Paenibacillus larvae]|nr:hypothetical protein [Paenibacillus larvae]MDT2263821.1 hypothetical protein [Paenibacillus larvae]